MFPALQQHDRVRSSCAQLQALIDFASYALSTSNDLDSVVVPFPARDDVEQVMVLALLCKAPCVPIFIKIGALFLFKLQKMYDSFNLHKRLRFKAPEAARASNMASTQES